jgi:hypothetical protein
VQEVPQVREGDVTIIPVEEEMVFVERRLVLKEKYESVELTKCKTIRKAWYCAGRRQ